MRKNRWIIAIVALLLCGACLAGAVGLKKGVSFGEKDEKLIRNPANIITPDMYEIESGGTGYGFKFDISEDGEIKLLGNKISTGGQIRVASLTLPAGTYTYSDNEYMDLKNFCFKLRTDDDASELLTPKVGINTFTIEEEKKIVLMFYFAEGFELTDDNRSFCPILVAGEDVQDFYVTESAETETAA